MSVPSADVSVRAFQGLGAAAGRTLSVPDSRPGDERGEFAPARPALPLAPAEPPEQTESIPGTKDNVLLREALAGIEKGATHEQLLGVLRQMLQGHLFLSIRGDAGEQLRVGSPLAVGIVNDGDSSYMLAFSSAAAVRDSVRLDTDPSATSVVVQPAHTVLRQVVEGPFSGLILDNASAPHRAVFPTEILRRALDQADPSFALKALLSAPRDVSSEAVIADALLSTRLWVAVRAPEGAEGQPGVAEARTHDGSRLLQVFSHPLEVIALGRDERPLPFSGEQMSRMLAGHPELAGVLVDPAGPTIVVRREALDSAMAATQR